MPGGVSVPTTVVGSSPGQTEAGTSKDLEALALKLDGRREVRVGTERDI